MISAVVLNNIHKSFGHGMSRVHVLKGIDLTLPAGEMVFLVGPSGCGKTTLISVAAGILTAEPESHIQLFGQELDQLSERQLSQFRSESIGFIFQQFNLVDTLTATENVAIPQLIQGKERQESMQRARFLLKEVGLEGKEDLFPKQLSGGQQQRVAIARALSNDPKLMICDEPTASLDSQTGQQVMELLKAIASSEGRCVIVVTHDNRIFQYADRMVTMEDGQVLDVLTGTALNEMIQKGLVSQ